MAEYAQYLAETFGSATKKKDRQILALCQLLNKCYGYLVSESQFLGPVAKAELPGLGQQFVGIYTALATEAKREGVKMWKLVPKFHLFLHLCEWQAITHGNPRYFWTYPDEDLAGIMADVAKSCHPTTMATSALFKWLHVAFE